jgi:hypothetical protein
MHNAGVRVAVFVMPRGGMMVELSLSGQQFTFEPK